MASKNAYTIVAVPESAIEDEMRVRDVKDRPLLRAAKAAYVDVLLTGDKDFLESDIDDPAMMSPRHFLGL